jgi:hypothetical protein
VCVFAKKGIVKIFQQLLGETCGINKKETTMANQNSGITVISNNAMLDSVTSHVEANTHVSDYLLEDVPHLSDYITDLPVCSTNFFSFCFFFSSLLGSIHVWFNCHKSVLF